MNTNKELVAIVLVMASITTLAISATSLVALAENGYIHSLHSGGDIDYKDKIENLDADIPYYDYIGQGIENPYEDGWD